jgi:hypothetical protein
MDLTPVCAKATPAKSKENIPTTIFVLYSTAPNHFKITA